MSTEDTDYSQIDKEIGEGMTRLFEERARSKVLMYVSLLAGLAFFILVIRESLSLSGIGHGNWALLLGWGALTVIAIACAAWQGGNITKCDEKVRALARQLP